MELLVERVAVITGASRGIGAIVARAFAREGARLVLAHEPSIERTREAVKLAAELNRGGEVAVLVSADLLAEGAAEVIVNAAIVAFGRLDIVVANAALQNRSQWDLISTDEWDMVQAVNLRSPWQLVKAAAPYLEASPAGSVIMVTSIMVESGVPSQIHYTASKAGLIGVARGLARAMGPRDVRVNAVMLGAVRTEKEEEFVQDAAAVNSEVLAVQSLQRRATADDVSGPFVFLASALSSFVTGQVVNVDGGWIHY
ncbi:SDR family NAD(P)-dependent oxidoreductase [Microbacterium sp. NPDC090218]